MSIWILTPQTVRQDKPKPPLRLSLKPLTLPWVYEQVKVRESA